MDKDEKKAHLVMVAIAVIVIALAFFITRHNHSATEPDACSLSGSSYSGAPGC